MVELLTAEDNEGLLAETSDAVGGHLSCHRPGGTGGSERRHRLAGKYAAKMCVTIYSVVP